MNKLGLIINPVAGIGGRVGLKGSDGVEALMKARELGATEIAQGRAVEALKHLASLKDQIELITYPGEMGEDAAKKVGFNPKIIGKIKTGETTSKDTKTAASEMVHLGIDLILFVGGRRHRP